MEAAEVVQEAILLMLVEIAALIQLVVEELAEQVLERLVLLG
jgi:hypothetical protein